jgi:hypothetical protein
VAEREQELVTTRADTRTVNWQFTKVTNKLQKVTNEESRLLEDNSKLSQDVNGKARCLQLRTLLLCSLLVGFDPSSRGVRAARISHRDDHEARGEDTGAERRPAPKPREG